MSHNAKEIDANERQETISTEHQIKHDISDSEENQFQINRTDDNIQLTSTEAPYDLTVIAPIDTLIGVDCLELAYRSSSQSYGQTQREPSNKPRYSIQLLGIKGGWDANLDSSALFRVNKQYLVELGKEKTSGTATYQNWQNLKEEKVGLQYIASKMVVLCLPSGNMAVSLLNQTGRSIIELAKETSTPLEELANWLNEPLLPIEVAHATYYRDYLPGLAYQGVHYWTKDNKEDNYCSPSVEKILNRVKAFQQSELKNEYNVIDTDACWRGLPLEELELDNDNNPKLAIQKYKKNKEVCFYLVDELEIKQQSRQSHYDYYKVNFLETLDQEFCAQLYDDASRNHQSLYMPTSLILFSAHSPNPTPIQPSLSDQLNRVERIEFATSKEEKESLTTLAALPELKGLAEIKVISGQFSHYFRADIIKKSNTDSRTVVDLIVNHLLGICLDKERPLISYGSTFFLPFRLSDQNKKTKLISEKKSTPYKKIINADDKIVKAHKEREEMSNTLNENEGERFNLIANERDAFLYLQPVIRERIFNLDKNSPQRIFESRASVSPDDELLSKDNERLVWSVKLEKLDTTQVTREIDYIKATVRSIKLHKFYNDVYILSVNVYERFFQGSSTSFTSENNNWWHDLYSKDKDTQKTIESSQIKHWLTYTDKIRQLYPSFATRKSDETTRNSFFFGKANIQNIKSTERALDFKVLTEHSYTLPDDFCEIFKQVGIPEPQELKFRPFIDNRLFVNTIYGLAGNLHINENTKKKYDALYSLAAYIDNPNQAWSSLGGYAYDPKFTQELLDEHTYQRWGAMGNKYAFTNYSNVYMGYGSEFNNKIAPCHVFYNYQYMLLVALFYRESLHDFSERMSEVSKQIATASQREFRQLRQDFIRFTNVSWFEELSSQIQGKEIYNKIIDGLDIKKDYEFLEKEISVTYQHFQETTAHKFTTSTFWLAIAALIGGAYSIYTENKDLGEQAMTTAPWGVPIILALLLIATMIQKQVFRSFGILWQNIGGWVTKSSLRKSIYWLCVIIIIVLVADYTKVFESLTEFLRKI